MSTSKITKQGQTTIPVEIRNHLGIKSGDRIELIIRPNGIVELRRLDLQAEELFGKFRYKAKKKVTIAEMDDAIRRRYLRRKKR